MTQRVSTMEVRARIGDMLNRVALRHDEFIIERKGKPLAALVPLERLEQMRAIARRHALDVMARQKSRPKGSALTMARPKDRALNDAQVAALAAEARRHARKRPRRRPRRAARSAGK